jgi:general L-amino acid transport system permease protein
LLGIAKSIVSQPQFIGLQREAYLFVTMIYWAFSYLMAYLSQRLEVALGVGER